MSSAQFSCFAGRRLSTATLALGAFALSIALASPAQAVSVIKRPGLHPNYSVEIEPHLLVHWSQARWGEDGWGPGVRFSIPFLDNGPIEKINNNMAISFGMDWAMFDDVCYYRRNLPGAYSGNDCSVNALWFPVALQWNFFLTDVISVFGEPGFGIEHAWWDSDYCDEDICHDSDTDLRPVFWLGARFNVSDAVGIVVRMGTPSISAGVSFLL